MKGPVRFFDSTPIGRIINRFSSDVYCVDDSLPFILNIFLAQAFGLVGTIAICCYGLPYFALLILPLAVIYYFIQVRYNLLSYKMNWQTAVFWNCDNVAMLRYRQWKVGYLWCQPASSLRSLSVLLLQISCLEIFPIWWYRLSSDKNESHDTSAKWIFAKNWLASL